MTDPHESANEHVSVLSRVRCLDCGAAYVKPAKGGTIEQNPGCPRCGYIGWIAASVDFTPRRHEEPTHSVSDLLRPRLSRRR